MASATKRLSLLVVNCAFRIPPRAHATQIRRPQWQKPFSVTCPRSNVERRAANEQSHQERAAEAQEVEEKQGFDNVAAVEKAEAPPEASPVEEQPSEATEEQLEAVARGGSVDGQALNAQYLTKQPLEESLVEDRVSEDTTPQQPDQHKTVTDAGAVEEPLLEPSEPEVVLESSSAEQNLLHSSTAESDRPAVSPSPLIDDQDLGALESHPDPATRPDGQSLLGSSSDEPVLVEEEVEDDEDVSEQLTIDAGSEDIPAVVSKGQSSGFWSYTTPGSGDEEFLKENVTSLGHDELEQQREYREYARLAAWELPLLSSE